MPLLTMVSDDDPHPHYPHCYLLVSIITYQQHRTEEVSWKETKRLTTTEVQLTQIGTTVINMTWMNDLHSTMNNKSVLAKSR